MDNRTIGFRCPQELVQAIEARAMATGKSLTQVLIDTLSQGLLSTPSSAPQTATPEMIPQRLSELQDQIEATALHLAESKESALDPELLARVEALEKAVSDLQRRLS